MIKSLRRKFILIALFSMIAVMLVISIGINISNRINVVRKTDAVLSVLVKGGGEFPEDFDGNKYDFPPSVRYDTRYFFATVDGNGNITRVELSHISVVNYDTAKNMVNKVKTRTANGFEQDFRYTVSATDTGKIVIFVDCRMELTQLQKSTLFTFIFFAVGIAAVTVIIILLSGTVIKPAVEIEKKQKRFITDAGHELKTPLSVISANAEILEMEVGENEWISGIHAQVDKLNKLTQNLVFLAGMDEGSYSPKMMEFSLSDAISETVENFKTVAAGKGLSFKQEITPLITYKGNEEMIRQLTSLLIDNAVKYAKGGEIEVSLKKEGKTNLFAVKNLTDNLAEGEHNELFERFYRPDGSRSSEFGGNGIGLSVADSIVKAHRGRITAVSPDGKSVVFKVEL